MTNVSISSLNTQIKEFDGEKLDYADVQIECKVAGNAIPHENITNIAEILEIWALAWHYAR